VNEPIEPRERRRFKHLQAGGSPQIPLGRGPIVLLCWGLFTLR
jgi:hypothetical protein